MIEGQLVIINYKSDKSCEYGFVKDCFDDKVRVQTKNGGVMYNIKKLEDKEWIDQDIKLTILTRNGKIVMAKRNWMGKPTPVPPYNSNWIFHDDEHLKEGLK